MKITVVQPTYFPGDNPCEKVAQFILEQMETVEKGELIVFPEYSNAGGTSDPGEELASLPRAKIMLDAASRISREKEAYIAINVLEERGGEKKNSTYLFGKDGNIKHIYDKIHLPPSELSLGVSRGDVNGNFGCVCDLDGIRFAFMTCYDVYFNEQIEFIANHKPDIILIPGYQRGERTDIICAQAKLTAFRCNAYVARSSYSMNDDGHGGNSMIVSPDGVIIENMGKNVGKISTEIDPKRKYMRSAGFGGDTVRCDDFISEGLCPEAF